MENISKDLDFLLYYDEEKEKEMINQCKIDDAKKEGIVEGRESGLKEGRESGLKEGTNQRNIAIAKEMLKDKVAIDTVAKYTGLTVEELSEIKRKFLE